MICHLNCGSLEPITLNPLFSKSKKAITHCVLLQSSEGFILIDAGISTHTVKDRSLHSQLHLGKLLRPRFKEEETAIFQLKKMGIDARQVKHIILTHLDFLQANALTDFPDAKVHVFGPEYLAGLAPANRREQKRYAFLQENTSGIQWVVHSLSGGSWFHLPAIQPLPHQRPDLHLVPLIGHTWGHCGVAFQKSDKTWIIHCGDAYYFNKELDSDKPKVPLNLKILEHINCIDEDSMAYYQEQLRRFKRNHPEVTLFCSKDPVEFKRLKATESQP